MKTQKVCLLLILISMSYWLNAQTEQMKRWAFIDKQANFSTNPPTLNQLSTANTTGEHVYNACYDENNNLLFRVVDNRVYTPSGEFIDYLFDDSEYEYYYIYGEMLITPASREDACEYLVWYSIYYKEYDEAFPVTRLCYTMINPGTKSVYGYMSNVSSNCRTSSFAVSDFIGSSETRRMYVITSYNYCDRSADSVVIDYYTVNYKDISLYNSFTLHNTQLELISECELSSDMDLLVVSNANPSNTSPNAANAHIRFIELDPIDGDFISTGYYYNHDSYPRQISGCEITADGGSLIYNIDGTGIYKINISNLNNISLTNSITNVSYNEYFHSQIERTTHGAYFVASNDGKLGEINFTNSSVIDRLTLGTSEIINNKLVSTFNSTAPDCFLIPDQIDGCEYNYTSNDLLSCCYSSTENIEERTIPGVNFDGNNITILSGYSVTWTPSNNPFCAIGNSLSEVFLKGDLTIQPGASLTLSGMTLHFKNDASVNLNYSTPGTVGPVLNITSDSRLTAFDNCENNVLWDGIICSGWWGVGYEQTAPFLLQPKVVINSNSIIEFAEIGIDVSCGGIVFALAANFRDNINDVHFSSWQNQDNISYFTNCNFYTTQNLYLKSSYPTYHVVLWAAPGIDFKGCNFYNNYAYNNGISITQWGTGILSSLSSFSLVPSLSVEGSMSNLYYGIKASQGDFTTINHYNFTDCIKGVWIAACDAITVTQNDFNVSSNTISPVYQYDSFGLYIESSTGYQIEENTFTNGLLGLVVFASGNDNNYIYRNTFQHLSGNGYATSVVGIGDNSNYPHNPAIEEAQGLQIKCNTFNVVDFCIAVLGGQIQTSTGTINVTTSDICQGQVFNGTTKVSAYNYFVNIPTVPFNYRYFYINGAVSEIIANSEKYTYRQTDLTGYRLNYYNPNHIIVNNYKAPTCASEIDLSKSQNIEYLISQTNDLTQYQSDLEVILEDLISYDELSLLITAQSANADNASQVYNNLYAASPHLTSEILLSYLNNQNVSELSRASLMLANSPLPRDVKSAIEKSEISPEIAAYILSHQNGENQLEQLNSEINSIKSARQVYYDHILRATFSADSIASFDGTYNYVLSFMETQTDLHAREKLVDLYIKRGMFENANQILNEIENFANINNDSDLLNSVLLTRIKIDIFQNLNNEPILDIVNRHQDYLTEIAADYNSKEGGTARAILECAGLIENFPIIFFPEPFCEANDKSIKVEETDNSSLNTKLQALFRLYPNPANEYLSIEFINPDGVCSFEIYTIKGELVKTLNSNQQLGFISINISDLLPGNYIINCPEMKVSESFIISR